ncbi:MAG: hypothetical protein V4726_00920 [Verrucomicrobiota bacterium]
MVKSTSEAFTAPLLSPAQRHLFEEMRTSCETAAINGASLADIGAACDLLHEHMLCAREDAMTAEATDALGIGLADEDTDGPGPGPGHDSESWKTRP